MNETNKEGSVIITGFNGFEVEFDKEKNMVDVKYKGESVNGVIRASVVGYDPKLLKYDIPVLKLEIMADVKK